MRFIKNCNLELEIQRIKVIYDVNKYSKRFEFLELLKSLRICVIA